MEYSKKIILLLILFVALIGILGCIDSSTSLNTTKEILVAQQNISYTLGQLGNTAYTFKIPDNAQSIRVAYDLAPKDDYGTNIGANGNLYTVTKPLEQGQDPYYFYNASEMLERDYLSANVGQAIKGNATFQPTP